METTIFLVYRDWSTRPEELGVTRAVLKGFTDDSTAAQFIQDYHNRITQPDDAADLELPPFLAEFGTPVSMPFEVGELTWAREGEITYAECPTALYSIEPLTLVSPDVAPAPAESGQIDMWGDLPTLTPPSTDRETRSFFGLDNDQLWLDDDPPLSDV